MLQIKSVEAATYSEKSVVENRLINIIEEKVVKLLKQNRTTCVDSMFDASFIKARSIIMLAR
jgi:hypothetical protein